MVGLSFRNEGLGGRESSGQRREGAGETLVPSYYSETYPEGWNLGTWRQAKAYRVDC